MDPVYHTSVKICLIIINYQFNSFLVALLVEDGSNFMTGQSDFLPEKNGVINFEKRRQFAQFLTLVQYYQSIPYSLTAVHSLQDKLLTMELNMTEQELLQLSWQSEMA